MRRAFKESWVLQKDTMWVEYSKKSILVPSKDTPLIQEAFELSFCVTYGFYWTLFCC